MLDSKYRYLKTITKQLYNMKSTKVDKELEGTTPPSVFIGSYNYPKVYAGPLLSPSYEDSSIMDQPEQWISTHTSQKDIINYRLNLVRGKQTIGITDLDNNYIEKLQEISMASKSIMSEAEFNKKPQGMTFSAENTPHGPSAIIKKFDIDNVKWDHQLEKAYYDTDLKAADAVEILHEKNVPFTQIQKAFSVGTMGEGKNRKLVPTRWSITAVDTTIADRLLENVRYYSQIDTYKVYEFESLNNYYAILEMPTPWQYEWMEAFLKVNGRKSMIFTDCEHNKGKKEYSRVGGCYYTAKMAVLEQLDRDKEQAGCIIFREANENYIPLGVFNVRENIRHAMNSKPLEFESLRQSLDYIETKLKLSVDDFRAASQLLDEVLKERQTTLDQFF
ncbi:Nre family DNA repair protein [uncultured Methanosphaera sp.]|uniref:Nre family DNA repair protein n=1 Tax=uncultured Methanosphaera sp. TaxID=262501 RepID=UPI0025E50925|nr:Nre family DNA repair protein [uncultured Methanosphaera sp.]